LNILIAAKDAQVKRMVYASSSSVYGNDTHWPKTEEFTGDPLSPYAATKAMNEMYANIFSRTYGLELIGLRYFNVFGPRQDPFGAYAAVIPLFMKAFLQSNSPLINGDGSNSRDFTYINNVVQANMRAAFTKNTEALNTAYNVAAGKQTSLNELVAIIKNLTKSEVNPTYGPDRAGDIPHSLADISKAQTLLGYNPTVTIDEGLALSILWYSQQFNN
jgi:UDP-N-acetylglucosamine 4-epimerase